MGIELPSLHATVGVHHVYVAHDQVEAIATAYEIVPKDGSIEQVGIRMELYDNPATPFLAGQR